MLPEIVKLGLSVSVDTIKASVARYALNRGLTIVNIVWGLHRDPDTAPLVAEYGEMVVVMQNCSGADATIDIMVDIAVFLARSLEIVTQTGVERDRIVVDQGIVFGRTPAQSFEVATKLAQSVGFEPRLLVGAPRKRFTDSLSSLRPERRICGSLATAAVGAAVTRIHETVQAVTIDQAIREAQCANRGYFRRRRGLYNPSSPHLSVKTGSPLPALVATSATRAQYSMKR